MKNNLSDLNNHLFSMLEELDDEKILNNEKKLDKALKRTNAMCKISKEILNVAKVQISAIKVAEDCGMLNQDMPALLAIKGSKDAVNENEIMKQKLIGGR